VFSSTKSTLFNKDIKPKYFGALAVRGVTKKENLKFLSENNIAVFLGPNIHLIAYPVGIENQFNLVVITRSKLDQNNLNKLSIFKDRYPDFRIGFMDHSDGALDDAYYLPLVAMGTGINVIEKHITLDRELEIEDYISGVTPSEFIKFVGLVRRFESVLGLDSLELTEQEEAYRNKATKSVVALTDLKAGDVLTLETVALKRCSKPITEHSILEIEQALGKSLKVDIKTDSPVAKVNI